MTNSSLSFSSNGLFCIDVGLVSRPHWFGLDGCETESHVFIAGEVGGVLSDDGKMGDVFELSKPVDPSSNVCLAP